MHPSATTESACAAEASGHSPNARRIEANRRNAQNSTGPKSSEGKVRASRNALQHGLLAQAATLVNEKNQELEGILAKYQSEFCPSGSHEDMLVRELAVSDWRLRQMTRIETGLLWTQMQEIYEDGDLSEANKDTRTLLMGAAWGNNPAAFSLIVRYQNQARRDYYRALKQFEQVRTGNSGYLPPPAPARSAEPPAAPKPEPPVSQTKPTAPAPKTAAAPRQTNPTPPSASATVEIPAAVEDFPYIDWREILGPRPDEFDFLTQKAENAVFSAANK